MDIKQIAEETLKDGYDYLFIGPHDEGAKTVVTMDCRLKSGEAKTQILDEAFPFDDEVKLTDDLKRLLNADPAKKWDVRPAYKGPNFVGIRAFGPQETSCHNHGIRPLPPGGGSDSGGCGGGGCGSGGGHGGCGGGGCGGHRPGRN